MAYGFPSILTKLRREMLNYKTFLEEQIASMRESVESADTTTPNYFLDYPSYAKAMALKPVDVCEKGTTRSSKGAWCAVLRRVPPSEACGRPVGFSQWGSTFFYVFFYPQISPHRTTLWHFETFESTGIP